MPELLVDRQVQGGCGSIITISLNRPEALNSLTATLIRDLCAQFKTLAADTTLVRILERKTDTRALVARVMFISTMLSCVTTHSALPVSAIACCLKSPEAGQERMRRYSHGQRTGIQRGRRPVCCGRIALFARLWQPSCFKRIRPGERPGRAVPRPAHSHHCRHQWRVLHGRTRTRARVRRADRGR